MRPPIGAHSPARARHSCRLPPLCPHPLPPQDAGGTRFGTIGKRAFKSALGIAFHHYTFTPEIYDDLCDFYGCGDDDLWDAGNVNGKIGKREVGWRDFCNDFLAAKKYDSMGREVKHAGNDGLAGRGDTTYQYVIPGAQ